MSPPIEVLFYHGQSCGRGGGVCRRERIVVIALREQVRGQETHARASVISYSEAGFWMNGTEGQSRCRASVA